MNAHDDFDRIGTELADQGVTISTMFGKPAYKDSGGKAFSCLFEETLAFRLVQGTPKHTAALAVPGAELFDPSGLGRAMRDWVCVPHTSVARWPEFAQAALRVPR